MRRTGRVILATCAAILVGVAAAGAVGNTLSRYDHNEAMYVAAGALVAAGERLYRDFAYLQAPNLPLLYGAIAATGAGGNLYFAAKLVSISATFLSGLFTFLLARRMTGDLWIAAMCAALLLTNGAALRAFSECSNYATPMAALFGSYYLFCIARPAAGRPWSSLAIMMAGMLASAAAGFKAYYALPALAMLCASLFHHRGLDLRSRLRRVTLPFAVGMAFGALPVAYYAASDFDTFAFNNYGYHELNMEWRGAKRTKAIGLASRFAYTERLLKSGTNPFVFCSAVGAALAALHARIREQQPSGPVVEDRFGSSAALLVLVAGIAALVPQPSWTQYFALPLSLGVVLVAAGLARTRASSRVWARVFIGSMVLGALWVSRGPTSKRINALTNPRAWASERVAQQARGIRAHLDGRRGALKGGSLSPLPLLAADVSIYNELSTGSFLYRVADRLSAEERQRYVATSPRTIGELFDYDPPDLIYGGHEKRLDGLLFDYAESHGYREYRVTGGRRLFVRP